MPVGDDSALYSRENIEDLLAKHIEAVGELRAAVIDILPTASVDGVAYDDIFLLRFILSYKNSKAATSPCRETLQWRIEHADILHKLTAGGKDAIPHNDTFMKFQTVGDISAEFAGWTTYVVRTAHSDRPALMSALTVEQVSDYLHYSKEL